ncbi:MAG: hypothetical protein K9I26_03055 [Flavobacterium sp.]|nr:hypothetical protein [Flavobacterium sp.]
MKIKNSELRIPIIINLIVVFFLYFDLLLPTGKIVKEEYLSSYNTVKYLPRIKGGGGKDIRNILETKSGNLYYLTSIRNYENEIISGQNIYISKTLLLSKVKSLKVSEQQKWNVSLLTNYLIISLYVLSTFITIINFFYTNKYFDILLSFSCAYILIVTASYIFYLS